MRLPTTNIPTFTEDFCFDSKYIDVLGTRLHYIEEGSGDPWLFIHGVPTWSYLWRNIIPQMSDAARCIAPDCVGMGRSDKPNIEYHVQDHIRYIEGFIEAMGLKNITLVGHAWGSLIAFDYARRHESNVKSLVFYEAYLRPPQSWDMVSLPMQELATLLKQTDGGYDAVMNHNCFVNEILPRSVLRRLTEKELSFYREPYLTPGSCLPLWQYLQDVPLFHRDCGNVLSVMASASEWLQQSTIPKLLLYSIPGLVTPVENIAWAKGHIPNLTIHEVGEGLQYIMETDPLRFGQSLRYWYSLHP